MNLVFVENPVDIFPALFGEELGQLIKEGHPLDKIEIGEGDDKTTIAEALKHIKKQGYYGCCEPSTGNIYVWATAKTKPADLVFFFGQQILHVTYKGLKTEKVFVKEDRLADIFGEMASMAYEMTVQTVAFYKKLAEKQPEKVPEKTPAKKLEKTPVKKPVKKNTKEK